jgi:hypothetical protein
MYQYERLLIFVFSISSFVEEIIPFFESDNLNCFVKCFNLATKSHENHLCAAVIKFVLSEWQKQKLPHPQPNFSVKIVETKKRRWRRKLF